MTAFPTGEAIRAEPLVTRVLAPNPSPFTYTGTHTHIVGSDDGDVAVIDPGPEDRAHLSALLDTIAGRRVTAIVVTHTHRDHSPGSRALAAATGAPIVGCASLPPDTVGSDAEASFDFAYRPDRVMDEGDTVVGEGWTLTAIATPGHTSNHLAFALPEIRVLFPGDHVMGWSTTVVAPPDGNMTDYMASLEKLLTRDDRIYYPAHGDAIEAPSRLVRGMLGHRKQREGQILRLIARDTTRIGAMVDRMYVGIDERLRGAAERSVEAHLIDLAARGLVEEKGRTWHRT